MVESIEQIEAELYEMKERGEVVELPGDLWEITCKGARKYLSIPEHRAMHRLKGHTVCEDHLV